MDSLSIFNIREISHGFPLPLGPKHGGGSSCSPRGRINEPGGRSSVINTAICSSHHSHQLFSSKRQLIHRVSGRPGTFSGEPSAQRCGPGQTRSLSWLHLLWAAVALSSGGRRKGRAKGAGWVSGSRPGHGAGQPHSGFMSAVKAMPPARQWWLGALQADRRMLRGMRDLLRPVSDLCSLAAGRGERILCSLHRGRPLLLPRLHPACRAHRAPF